MVLLFAASIILNLHQTIQTVQRVVRFKRFHLKSFHIAIECVVNIYFITAAALRTFTVDGRTRFFFLLRYEIDRRQGLGRCRRAAGGKRADHCRVVRQDAKNAVAPRALLSSSSLLYITIRRAEKEKENGNAVAVAMVVVVVVEQ